MSDSTLDNLARHAPRSRFMSRYGPWAVVTGASDGIGRELALGAAARGLSVVVCARRRQALDELASRLETDFGVDVLVVDADLGTREGVAKLLETTSGLDVGLFAAAAGFGTSGDFLDGVLEDELGMIDVNCRAVAELSHAFGRRLVQRGLGGIVLFSSLVAFQGVPRAANYAATKAYVQSFAEALALELAPSGIDVLASAPGPVGSGFARRARMVMGSAATPRVVAEGTLNALGRSRVVRPGWLSKLLELSLATLPRAGRVRMMGVVMAGMTKHAQSPSLPRLSQADRP